MADLNNLCDHVGRGVEVSETGDVLEAGLGVEE